MKIRAQEFIIPFNEPFTISKATKTAQHSLVVELDHFGIKGYGEAPAITYYNVTVADMLAKIELKRPFLEKFSFQDPERWWHYLHHLFPADPFLVCALDMAGWDLFGKMKRRPLQEIWGLDTENAPATDLTIGIDSEENMIGKIRRAPWPVYKIKAGFANDIDVLRKLRTATDVPFRIDVNEGWTRDEAREKIALLADLNVEMIEQPISKDDREGMKELFETSPLPLFADESCVAENDVQSCAGLFHGVNIKLTKCSGITPARRMIDKCRELDLRVMLGCMNESVIGSAALAHLAPLADMLDADGPLLQTAQNATGLTYDGAFLKISAAPGLGIEPLF